MNCPVCAAPLKGAVCSVCGYDRSRDYAQSPTFGPVGKALSVSGLRTRRVPKDALFCEKCGGTAFTITIPEGTRLCCSCGWSPKPAPRLACACGSRYFAVRMTDGALECPLCGSTTPLAQLNTWFPPKPPEPVEIPATPKVVTPPAKTPKSSKKLKITAIAAGGQHTAALRADGTVRAVGSNKYGQCDVNAWKDIVAISAGYRHTAGKKADGTWIVTGEDPKRIAMLFNTPHVTAVSASPEHTLVLYDTGHVRGSGQNSNGQLFVKDWLNVKAIAAGTHHSIALTNTGSILAVGSNFSGQRYTLGWNDITAIAAGHSHTVGLRRDGTVLYAGKYDDGPNGKLRQVLGWKNITAIAAGSFHTVGLKSDGSLVTCGTDVNGACNVEKLSEA